MKIYWNVNLCNTYRLGSREVKIITDLYMIFASKTVVGRRKLSNQSVWLREGGGTIENCYVSMAGARRRYTCDWTKTMQVIHFPIFIQAVGNGEVMYETSSQPTYPSGDNRIQLLYCLQKRNFLDIYSMLV